MVLTKHSALDRLMESREENEFGGLSVKVNEHASENLQYRSSVSTTSRDLSWHIT